MHSVHRVCSLSRTVVLCRMLEKKSMTLELALCVNISLDVAHTCTGLLTGSTILDWGQLCNVDVTIQVLR